MSEVSFSSKIYAKRRKLCSTFCIEFRTDSPITHVPASALTPIFYPCPFSLRSRGSLALWGRGEWRSWRRSRNSLRITTPQPCPMKRCWSHFSCASYCIWYVSRYRWIIKQCQIKYVLFVLFSLSYFIFNWHECTQYYNYARWETMDYQAKMLAERQGGGAGGGNSASNEEGLYDAASDERNRKEELRRRKEEQVGIQLFSWFLEPVSTFFVLLWQL